MPAVLEGATVGGKLRADLRTARPRGQRSRKSPAGLTVDGAMQVTIRLEEATLRQVFDELLPLRILLDDEPAPAEGAAPAESARWFQISPVEKLDLVENEGIRIVTGGQLSWTAAGLPMMITLQSAK